MSAGTILVVDDDEDVREIVALVLGTAGYDVQPVGTADDALLLLRSGATPSVVLIDLRMPGMSPAQFVATLRAEPRTRPLPVYVISGDGEAQAEAARMGADGFLAKPVELDDLLALARRYVPAEEAAHPL